MKAVIESAAKSGFAFTYGAVRKALKDVKGVFAFNVARFLAKNGLSVKGQAAIVKNDGSLSDGAPAEVHKEFKKIFGNSVPQDRLIKTAKPFDEE